MKSIFKFVIISTLLCFCAYTATACTGNNPTQLSALQDLYSSTSGKNWNFRSSVSGSAWESNSDYCSWKGVGCDASCSYVTTLVLDDVGMKGVLPFSFSSLTGIQTLVLSNNPYLNGSLPTSILTLFSSLKMLSIYGSSIGGTITGANGGCTPSLQNLNIGNTGISGYDFSQCKGLQTIVMEGTFFHYNFPISTSTSSSQCNFPSLTYVDFENAFRLNLGDPSSASNYFNVSCFCQSPLLEYLDLAGNYLGGMLPDCLSTLPNLQYLLAGSNSYTSFRTNGGYKKLTVLDLGGNVISEDFSTLSFQSLVKGVFTSNKFYGTPFLNISPLLEVLYIDGNNFSGDFPNPTAVPPFLQFVDARKNPGMSYTKYYFDFATDILVTDLQSSSSPTPIFCTALQSSPPKQKGPFVVTIYVSSTYYLNTPYYTTSCATVKQLASQ